MHSVFSHTYSDGSKSKFIYSFPRGVHSNVLQQEQRTQETFLVSPLQLANEKVAVKKRWDFIQGHADPEEEEGDGPTAPHVLFIFTQEEWGVIPQERSLWS